jgi:very-short-patch-repair endonuclease
MTKHYNKTSEKEKRRKLRQNSTRSEDLVWRFLRNRQMFGYKFRRQYSIDKYVLDFFCPEIKFAVELDGATHHDPEQKVYDNKRQKYLEAYGIKFIRIPDEDLFGNPDMVFEKIEKAIKDLTPSSLPESSSGQTLSKERGV